jgi:hypothetical protein
MPDMPAFFLQLAGWLLNPKTIGYAIVGLIALALAAYGFWSWETIKTLQATQASLVTANKTLVQNNNILVANDKALQNKTDTIAQKVTDLTNKFSSASQQQQQQYHNIVTPPPATGQTPDTQDMQNRANTGINDIFNNLNSLSQSAAQKATKK